MAPKNTVRRGLFIAMTAAVQEGNCAASPLALQRKLPHRPARYLFKRKRFKIFSPRAVPPHKPSRPHFLGTCIGQHDTYVHIPTAPPPRTRGLGVPAGLEGPWIVITHFWHSGPYRDAFLLA
eukprot:825867-Pelagomonas_calceolata.AAC.8